MKEQFKLTFVSHNEGAKQIFNITNKLNQTIFTFDLLTTKQYINLKIELKVGE